MNASNFSIDEYPIAEIPVTPLWSENYAVMFGDPANGTAIFYSIGRNLADRTIWREFISIALPGRGIIFSKNYGRGASPSGPGGGLTKLDVLEVERSLRLTFSGPVTESTHAELVGRGYREGPRGHCKLDVRFDAIKPIWNMKGDSREAGTIAGSMHFEQIGVANGSVEYDGRIYPLTNGYSVRDHSRGIRDISQYRMHWWVNGHFPDGRAFAFYAMQMQGSPTFGMTNAVVIDHDTCYPAQLVRADIDLDPEDWSKCHTVMLASDLGEMEIRVGNILASFPNCMVYPFDMCPGRLDHTRSAFQLDQLVTFECDGQEGIGWTERGVAREPLV